MVDRPLMVHSVLRLISHGGPTELFLIPASAPCVTKAMLCTNLSVGWCIWWDGAYKRTLIRKSNPCSGSSRFPLLLSDLSGPLPWVRYHKTIFKVCGVHH